MPLVTRSQSAALHPSSVCRWLSLGLAIAVAGWPLRASAAEPGLPQATPAARPAASAVPPRAPASRANAVRNPIDVLREKLAAKLGATRAPESRSPYVVRVISRSAADPAAAPAASSPDAAAPAAPRARSGSAGERPSVAWSYEGGTGPESWATLRPDFARCANGTRQSPIDIRDGIAVDLEPIRFDYRPSGFSVLDNGTTVQVTLASGNSIEVLGRRYELTQLHFHRPSEERIDGRRFDMSVHLEHRDPQGRLAVVAVPLHRGTANPALQTVWNNLPLEKHDELIARTTIDPAGLLPSDARYYTYMGSMTTPPCTEGVLWMVMRQPVTASMEQIAIFARLYPMNARPVQSASGRLIKQSN